MVQLFRETVMLTRQHDLTPLDNFHWGYVKSYVYKNHPLLFPELKVEISRVISEKNHNYAKKSMRFLTS